MRSGYAFTSKMALAIVSLLAALAVCELALRAWVPIREVGPTVTTYDPFYGKALRRSFSVQRTAPEFTIRITTNSLGFRGPELGALSRRPILFLGDSFTLGYGVDDGQEFPALVGRSLRERDPEHATPVINAGLGNNGNGRAVKLLRAEGPEYDPALVVLQIHFTDFEDNVRDGLFELTPAGELRERAVPSPSRARRIWELVEGLPIVGGVSSSYLVGLLRQSRWIRHGIQTHPGQDAPTENLPVDDEVSLTIALLQEAVTICERAGWPVLAVPINVPDAPRAAIERMFSSHQVPVVVIPRKSERPDLYYTIDGHMNATGHVFTAERILAAIETIDLAGQRPRPTPPRPSRPR